MCQPGGPSSDLGVALLFRDECEPALFGALLTMGRPTV